MELARQLWMILRISFFNLQSSRNVFLYIVVLLFELANIPVSVRLIQWTNDFYSALEQFDGPEAARQVGVYALLIAAISGLALASDYLRKFLVMRWRQDLTASVLTDWLSDKTYWRLQNGYGIEKIDNPDQRIAEDCRLFVKSFVEETLDLITSVTGLFTYIAVLWSLSNFPLEFTMLGWEVAIPRYMVWAAFLYVFLSSALTHWLGYPLKGLTFNQQRKEADFRFDLVRLRENADPVAVSGFEGAERRRLDGKFDAIVANWKRLILREFYLGCFKVPYFRTILRIPLLLALPAYFAGHVTFGGLMQLASAFQRVVTTLSWFIFAYNRLAELAATTSRLGDLLDAIRKCKNAPPSEISVTNHAKGTIEVRDLVLESPTGKPLQIPADWEFKPGEHVWISGPSGLGKSTFLKTLADIWPYGHGEIHIPADKSCAFIPQRSTINGTRLAEGAIYPRDAGSIDPETISEYLAAVGLPDQAQALQEGGNPDITGFSGGELQRLALIRLLIEKPDWAFLDEASSAIDSESEAEIFTRLRALLPETTFVLVAHRPPGGFESLRHVPLFPDPETPFISPPTEGK
ncbi:ABC transporter ATP-binding protein/permease [uncultured Sneathiella sp.]|uniref:ABC transporter ATP-binding protein/permease n=1 Tax=uncultured Sneathiella sp. TaxID=879315 RepID=UPI0030EB6546|tara:strand:- start:37359 stop:39089 length:1731 start_codon:yes stop_codon:yes gene_type:complete